MTQTQDSPAGPVRPGRPRAAWIAAAGLALLALLLGSHSARRLLAVTACDPRPASVPDGEDAQARALRGARRASSADPADGRCRTRAGSLLLAKAERLRKEGKTGEAREAWAESLESLERALAANPLDATAHREIVLVLERLGRPAEADAFVDRAARLFPAHSDLQFKLGVFLLERRAFRMEKGSTALDVAGLNRAFARFRVAAEADPAVLDRALELVQASVPGLSDASALVPDTLPARLRYARFLEGKGRWDLSTPIVEEALSRGQDSPDLRIRAGQGRLRAGDEKVAFGHFEAAFRRWLLSPNQIRQIGDAFLAARREHAGLDFFLSLDRLDPDESLPVRMALGRLYWSLGRWSESEAYFGKAAVEDSDAEAYYYLGLMSEKIGDLYAAERNLKQALRGFQARPEYHHKMAQILERMNRVPDALREYEMASRLNPANEAWRRDRERMERRWREGK